MPKLTGVPGPGGTWRMQQMSFAYVKAVAAAADCAVELDSVDRDSIDLTLKWAANAGRIRSPRLEVQAKSTYRNCLHNDVVKYQLKRKNYEDLAATNVAVPRILVLLYLPRNVEEWVAHSEAELAVRRCAYWVSIRGMPPLGQKRSSVVSIPRAQQFDVDGLHQIFLRLSNEELP